MSSTSRLAMAASSLLLVCCVPPLSAEEKPPIHKPKYPPSKQELDRREAQRLFAVGALQERKNLLVEAVRSFEAAKRLDPDSAAILRALVPLYFALDRHDDALAACKVVLKLDPDDFQTAGLYARHLRLHGSNADAITVLARAAKSTRLEGRPELAAQVWFDLGQTQHQTRDLAGAIGSFEKLAGLLDNTDAMLESSKLTREEIKTQAAETYERLARLNLEAGKADAAAKAFEEAQKRDPTRAARLALNLAQVYESQNKFREALAQAETYLRTQPQGTEGYELRVTIQRRMGRASDVVPDLEKSSGRDPHNVALKLLLAREYVRAKQPKDAEKVYLNLLDRQVAGEIYKGLFEVYREEGRKGAEKVLDMLDKAVKRGMGDDNNPGKAGEAASARAMLAVLKEDRELFPLLLAAAVRRLAADDEEDRDKRMAYATRSFLATLAARTRQLDHAEKLFRSCLDKINGPREMEADVYNGLLRVLQLGYKHEAVIEVCKTGLKKAQVTSRLLFLVKMGSSYLYLGKYDESIAAFEESVRVASRDQQLYCKRMLVDALSAAGKHERAVKECQAMLKEYNQGSQLREVRASLSSVYQAMGKHDLADKQLLLILEADPNDVTANNDLGYVWADRNKNLDEAEKMVRKAIDLDRRARVTGLAIAAESDEDHAAYVDSLGWVLFRQGKLDEAKAELEKASKMSGGDDDPTVWDHLGDVYHRLKQKDKAVTAWKKALSLYDRRTRRPHAERYKEIQDKIEANK